jgi:hypothetical protein
MKSCGILIAGLLLASAMPPAQGFTQSANRSSELGIGKPKPGQFLWSPELAPSGPMIIVVDLAVQRAFVYRNGVEIGATSVSSGRRGHETPTGVFTILQKDKVHRSKKYDDAPMPYMQRLTWSGIAMHGGHVTGHPASHGCVRLPMKFSQTLFDETRTGMTVIITDGDPSLDAAFGLGPQPGSDGFRWQPELSPAGPVTIMVSLKNQSVMVLRDGMVIGRSQAEIPASAASDPRALQILATGQSAPPQWFYAGASNPEAASRSSDAGQKMQVSVPPEFLADMHSVVTPGATMLIVEDAVTGGGAPPMVMVSG